MALTANGTSQPTSLHSSYPWTKSPLIVSAPMGGFATAPLATAVSLAGGIGLIGSVTDMAALDTELQSARQKLIDAGMLSSSSPPSPKTLPIGVGFLLFILEMSKAVEIVKTHRPAVIWLSFAREMANYARWAVAMREASPDSKIWIQLGTVAAALEVVPSAKPDVLVMQGADHGGHGFERAAGITSLVPETIDALAEEGFGHVPVLAAGGVGDGRGVAAALSLGARGVVMGTRFLGAKECVMPHPRYREVVLGARDGGQATVKAKVFDQLRGPNIWPEAIDGRAIRNASWEDRERGVDIEEVRRRYAEVAKGSDGGYGESDGERGRTMIWAGSCVGLVNKTQRASDILEEVRQGARRALEKARSSL